MDIKKIHNEVKHYDLDSEELMESMGLVAKDVAEASGDAALEATKLIMQETSAGRATAGQAIVESIAVVYMLGVMVGVMAQREQAIEDEVKEKENKND